MTYPQIYSEIDSIIARMKAGERLRWVPRNISRDDTSVFGQTRDLFIGRQRVQQEVECILASDKRFYHEADDGEILHVYLAEQPTKVAEMEGEQS